MHVFNVYKGDNCCSNFLEAIELNRYPLFVYEILQLF